MMIQDMNRVPGKEKWAALVRHLLGSLVFNEVWLAQGVGNENMFINLVRQRLHDYFIRIGIQDSRSQAE